MDELEKVIEGLESIKETLEIMRDKQGVTWVANAIAMLKAQVPRVMTLMEVLATEVVYAEDIDKAEIIPVLVDRWAHDSIVLVRARLMGSPSLTIYPLISEYGKRWRCWTSRPTDEQREATPWE